MKRLLRLVTAAAAAAVFGVMPAHAVIGGSPDGNLHPYVGLSVFYDANGVPLWRCSGTLVSPTLYVTAGHCAGPEEPGAPQPASAQIWFTADAPARNPAYPGNGASCNGYTGYPCTGDAAGLPVPSPSWTGILPSHDIGVVRLATPVATLGTATLAPLGYLDGLAKKRGQQDVSLTIVGYGVETETPKVEVAVPARTVGTVQLDGLTADDVLTTGSQGNGTGGAEACYGDSGGPVFSGQYLVALSSYGITKYCTGRSGAFRLDTAEARSFLTGF
jgi:hypothetical protein